MTEPTTKRRWFQFSLASLLILWPLIGIIWLRLIIWRKFISSPGVEGAAPVELQLSPLGIVIYGVIGTALVIGAWWGANRIVRWIWPNRSGPTQS
jgi:hypothetical protein